MAVQAVDIEAPRPTSEPQHPEPQPEPQTQQQQPPQQQQQQQPEKQQTAKGPQTSAPRLAALDGPRWIASAHVVGCHYYASLVPYFAQGGLWTQFFFMLGGFLLAYAEMTKPPAKRSTMPLLQYLRKRLLTIYPLYMFTLVLVIFTMAPRSAFDWSVLPLHLLLLQAIFPVCIEHDDGRWECATWKYNNACWFISVLLVYWVVLRPLARFFERVSLRGCYAWLLFLWAWSLVTTAAFMVCSHAPWALVAISMVKAGPLGFAHVFVSGVVTARIFILVALRDVSTGERPTLAFERLGLVAEGAPLPFRFGCCLGYLLWFAVAAALVVCSPGPEHESSFAPHVFFHQGGTIPLMALILLGGAVGRDPMARLVFSSRIFAKLARLSYAQYLLQLPVGVFLAYYLCPDVARAQQRMPSDPQDPVFLAVFPFALLLAAHLAESFVGMPYTEWLRARERQGLPNSADRVQACCGAAAAAVQGLAAGARRLVACGGSRQKLGKDADVCSDSDTCSTASGSDISSEADSRSTVS